MVSLKHYRCGASAAVSDVDDILSLAQAPR